MKRYLIMSLVLVVLTLLLISGCQVPKTGRAYPTPLATAATQSASPTTKVNIDFHRNLRELLLRSGPIGTNDKYIGVDVANSQGVAPLAIKGYCGDQLIDSREQCDFYGDGTPMFPLNANLCTDWPRTCRRATGGTLGCYPPGTRDASGKLIQCKVDCRLCTLG